MTYEQNDIARLADLVDRHGADFSAWPDDRDALWARQAVMADPAARQVLDEARRLDQMLGGHAASLDSWVQREGIADRTAKAVLSALPEREPDIRRWLPRIAAGFLVASVLGGAFDRFVWHGASADTEIVTLDTLLYGPDEVEF